MLAGAGGAGCDTPLVRVHPSLHGQHRLPEPCVPREVAGSGSGPRRKSAGSGRGASPSLALKHEASLKPIPKEPALQ